MKKIMLILIMLLVLINLFGEIIKYEDMEQFQQKNRKVRSEKNRKVRSAHIGLNFARWPSFGLSMNYNNIYVGIVSRDDTNKLRGSDFTQHPNWHNYENWRETNRASLEMVFEFGYYTGKYKGISVFPYIGAIRREYFSEYYNGNTYHFVQSKNNKISTDFVYGCGVNYKWFLVKVAKEPGYVDINGNKKDNIGIQLGITINLPEENKFKDVFSLKEKHTLIIGASLLSMCILSQK